MTLSSAEILFVKSHSVEAVRESLQKIWESCLPRRKVAKANKGSQSQYFLPDFNKPLFLRKRKEDILKESKKFRMLSLLQENLEASNATPREADAVRSPTTHQVLHWRSARKAAASSTTTAT